MAINLSEEQKGWLKSLLLGVEQEQENILKIHANLSQEDKECLKKQALYAKNIRQML